jgi:hypothetical protein
MTNRRVFFAWLAATVPVAAFARRAHTSAVDALSGAQGTDQTALLNALGEAILPSELGASGQRAAVAAFQRWIMGYRDHAELDHDYGNSRLRFSAPTPATRWATQLAALDTNATSQFQQPFARLTPERRRGMVWAALGTVASGTLPALATAPHVALALLAHFYASPAATDLCYEAQIGKLGCRPLEQVSAKPLPLAPRRG